MIYATNFLQQLTPIYHLPQQIFDKRRITEQRFVSVWVFIVTTEHFNNVRDVIEIQVNMHST
jgi:hypothetical protein